MSFYMRNNEKQSGHIKIFCFNFQENESVLYFPVFLLFHSFFLLSQDSFFYRFLFEEFPLILYVSYIVLE